MQVIKRSATTVPFTSTPEVIPNLHYSLWRFALRGFDKGSIRVPSRSNKGRI